MLGKTRRSRPESLCFLIAFSSLKFSSSIDKCMPGALTVFSLTLGYCSDTGVPYRVVEFSNAHKWSSVNLNFR